MDSWDEKCNSTDNPTDVKETLQETPVKLV